MSLYDKALLTHVEDLVVTVCARRATTLCEQVYILSICQASTYSDNRADFQHILHGKNGNVLRQIATLLEALAIYTTFQAAFNAESRADNARPMSVDI
jgi:hypothetical protein